MSHHLSEDPLVHLAGDTVFTFPSEQDSSLPKSPADTAASSPLVAGVNWSFQRGKAQQQPPRPSVKGLKEVRVRPRPVSPGIHSQQPNHSIIRDIRPFSNWTPNSPTPTRSHTLQRPTLGRTHLSGVLFFVTMVSYKHILFCTSAFLVNICSSVANRAKLLSPSNNRRTRQLTRIPVKLRNIQQCVVYQEAVSIYKPKPKLHCSCIPPAAVCGV